jgi:capsular exopolysaccharide synthesis family protein
MKRRVLIIDGDTRSPRLHQIFGVDNSVGLTTVLKQISGSSALSETYIAPTSVPNLHVLTSGPSIASGADLLFSSAMPVLISRLREQYDMVLIDTPPMLVMPDARVLGRAADAVVLIARSKQTARTAIQAAFHRFVEDQTPVIGIVLNDWAAKTSAYSHYAEYQQRAAETAVAKISPAGA